MGVMMPISKRISFIPPFPITIFNTTYYSPKKERENPPPSFPSLLNHSTPIRSHLNSRTKKTKRKAQRRNPLPPLGRTYCTYLAPIFPPLYRDSTVTCPSKPLQVPCLARLCTGHLFLRVA